MFDVAVVGAGPAGVVAALRAADLGARTVLVTRDEFGGMAANDGPVPVRTLAQAARLVRDARELPRYGVSVSGPVLDYERLLTRVREVVADVRRHSAFRAQLETAGAVVHERAGRARLAGPHTIETASGLRIEAEKIVLCTGGRSRRLSVPGFDLTSTHSDAWGLGAVPESMLVVGGGATGVQVASIFHGLGSRVELYQAGPRILTSEDEDVSAAVAAGLRESGVAVHEGFGTIERFEKSARGVRMIFAKDGVRGSAVAALVVVAVGWTADTDALALATAGVETDPRGFVQVDEYLQTSAPHVFAAGDVTGQAMLVPPALSAGFVAGTNAVRGRSMTLAPAVGPVGSFTDPEYANVGLTERDARATYDVVVATVNFASATRPIIDGRTAGFCKLVVDRSTARILGCHLVGDRAVDIVQLAAVAMAGGMTVRELAHVPLSFPTYAGILQRAAASAARTLNLPVPCHTP